jgi:FkbM family methyltransferase
VAGWIARQALRGPMRSHAARQREIDEALTEAAAVGPDRGRAILERLDGLVGRQGWTRNTETLADRPVTVTAEAGDLLLSRSDRLITGHISEHGEYEPQLTAYLRENLRPGMTFVDIGANVGYFSVLASRLVGPEGAVIAVEPGPANVALLRSNLWRNGCANATVLPIAAHVRRGHAQMVLSSGGGSGNWLQEGQVDDPAVLVPCAPLDDLLGDMPVDIVKCDAEGSDVFAIMGMRKAIAANPDIKIVAEFWPAPAVLGDDSASRSLVVYRDMGLSFGYLEGDGSVTPTDGATLLAMGGTVPMVSIVLTRG